MMPATYPFKSQLSLVLLLSLLLLLLLLSLLLLLLPLFLKFWVTVAGCGGWICGVSSLAWGLCFRGRTSVNLCRQSVLKKPNLQN